MAKLQQIPPPEGVNDFIDALKKEIKKEQDWLDNMVKRDATDAERRFSLVLSSLISRAKSTDEPYPWLKMTLECMLGWISIYGPVVADPPELEEE